jgi:hypothetical protein
MRKGYDYPGVAIVFFCHDGNGNFVMSKRGSQARDEGGAVRSALAAVVANARNEFAVAVLGGEEKAHAPGDRRIQLSDGGD